MCEGIKARAILIPRNSSGTRHILFDSGKWPVLKVIYIKTINAVSVYSLYVGLVIDNLNKMRLLGIMILLAVVPAAVPDRGKFSGGQCCCCCKPGRGRKRLRPKILEGLALDRAGSGFI